MGDKIRLGQRFKWMVTVANTDLGDVVFAAGDTIIESQLPPHTWFGTPTVDAIAGITNLENFGCYINDQTQLICTARGGSVALAGSVGELRIDIPAKPFVIGWLRTPPLGEICQLDPHAVIVDINPSNNSCENELLVTPMQMYLPTLLVGRGSSP